MAVGTAFQQVRLYDVRSNSTTRRPTAYTPDGVFTHRITATCPVDDHELVVGDAAGFLYLLDIRTMGKQRNKNQSVARFVGPAGSVRQVVKHDSLAIICTVGLDRMLRTFDLQTRTQVDCVYMKQRLNCVLFCKDDSWNVQQEENDHVVEEYQGDDTVDAEDEVQDYIDSSGDEQDVNGDDDSKEQSDDDSDEDSQEDESQESDDDESDASDSEEDEQVTRQREFKRQKRDKQN